MDWQLFLAGYLALNVLYVMSRVVVGYVLTPVEVKQ